MDVSRNWVTREAGHCDWSCAVVTRFPDVTLTEGPGAGSQRPLLPGGLACVLGLGQMST